MTNRSITAIVLFAGASVTMGCDVDAEKAAECAEVCSKVEECGANPPEVVIPGLTEGGSGVAAVDCGANCLQPDAAFYGYSDCQNDCILESACGAVNDCWDATSDTYASFCLEGVETEPIEPADEESTPDNGTNTGSAAADELTGNTVTEGAVGGSGFVVNTGNDVPEIAGEYGAEGEIDESMNARAPGSPIRTSLCFYNRTENADGVEITYCETGVPGDLTAPVTGSGNDFTMYFEYPGAATVLFSGSTDGAGQISGDVEALVVYLHGHDIWEHSWTTWTYSGECSGC